MDRQDQTLESNPNQNLKMYTLKFWFTFYLLTKLVTKICGSLNISLHKVVHNYQN